MRLALFTPVAYIWPVHRSFEAFLASLAMPARDAQDVASSPLYPATVQADSPPQGLPPRLDERLLRLHRSLYDAMLRPLGFFAREHAGFSDYFYADLHGTAFELLLSAFVFHFIRREARTLPVATGLTVFRTTFFNHEASEPAHWVDTALSRLAPERDAGPVYRTGFTAPAHARVQDLAFTINTALDRPPSGSGWISGTVRRGADGLAHIAAECGIDPGAAPGDAALERQYRAEMEAALCRVFGWESLSAREVAA